ncbi:MAG: sulfatase-like hydrolase/transferase [Acidobacteriota bacterium]
MYRKNVVLSGIVFFATFLIIFSAFSYSNNLTPLLHLNIKGEFDSPLIFKEATNINFYKGWFDIKKSPTSVSLSSIYRFFSYGGKDISIELELIKRGDYKKSLKIDLLINDHYVKRLDLDKKSLFSVSISDSNVRAGDNFLKFKIVDPPDSFFRKDTSENKLKFFTLKRIYFKSFSNRGKLYTKMLEKEKDFFQPSNTFFTVTIDPESDKNLNVIFFLKGTPLKDDCVVIKRKDSNNKIKIIEKITLKKGKVTKNYRFSDLKKGKLFKYIFEFKSKKSFSFLVWEKFIVNRKSLQNISKVSARPLKTKPHIFFIVLDAARADLLNRTVNGVEVTPFLNGFFNKAVNYTNFFSNAPFTGSSMASFFTSMLSEVHSLRNISDSIPPLLKTIPLFLKRAGFRSYAFIGNLVLLNLKVIKDFDEVIPIADKEKLIDSRSYSSYNDIDKVLGSIKKLDLSRPNFVYIHFLPPHRPYKPPEKKFKEFSSTNSNIIKLKSKFNGYSHEFLNSSYLKYLDNAGYGDYLLGEVLSLLKKKNIFENSMIIVTSDHGDAFGEHELVGHLTSNYMEMIYIPFAIKFPGRNKKKIIESFCSNIDLLPTIASLFGITPDPAWQGDVMSQGKKGNRKLLYSRAVDKEINSSVLDTGKKYKYIYNSGISELYNISSDPFESKNISEHRPFYSSYFKRLLFEKIIENTDIRKYLKLAASPVKFSEKDKKVLKSLGYLK